MSESKLLKAAHNVMAHYMPMFPDSRCVDDCLVELAVAIHEAEHASITPPPPVVRCADSDGCPCTDNSCAQWCMQKHHYQAPFRGLSSMSFRPCGTHVDFVVTFDTMENAQSAREAFTHAALRGPQSPPESGWPAAWVRGVVSYSPGEPNEHDYEFSGGDDQPEGNGWIPLYTRPPAALAAAPQAQAADPLEFPMHSHDELTLRRLLAFSYSGTHLYGDDGELQDGRFPTIDYRRDSVQDIETKIHQRGMDIVKHNQDQCKHEEGPNGYCPKCFKVQAGSTKVTARD